jgi:putative transposase
MRGPRIKEEGEAYYHMISRVVDRRMLFDTNEKERFRKVLRRVEAFCGVDILTYAILDNHFHLLIHVPARRDVSDPEFLERLACLYDSTLVENLAKELHQRRSEGQHEAAEALKAEFTYRMYDLSEFGKTLKQRISQSYNRRHGRKGTMWEERFKSVITQGKPGALAAMAAYIDLNAVRAGIVADPKDYRYSGYGEAMGGSERAREGLTGVFAGENRTWRQVAREYRQFLYIRGEAKGLTPEGKPLRKGLDPAKVAEVLKAGGDLTLNELLHCRVRYFTDGLILGSQDYVDDVFQRFRSRFGEKRQSGARPMRGCFTELCSARRLRLAVITVPATG